MRKPESDQDGDQNGQDGQKFFNKNVWRIVLLIAFFALVFSWVLNLTPRFGGASEISYSAFRRQLNAGNVAEVTVSGDKIEGRIRGSSETDSGFGEFVTYLPSFGDLELFALLEQNGVEVVTRSATGVSWLAILLNSLPLIILVWLAIMFYRGMQSRGQNLFSVARNQAKLYKREKQRTTFDDVAGIEGAKDELKEIIDFLRDPGRYQKLGAKSPKGVLLVGPPGTGKTLLARAVAGEADVPFYSITGSDFMELFVGVGAARVRNLFGDAKKNSPSIVFIDELDSIGRHRGAGLGGGHDEREQTLNQLLSELDGFQPNDSTIVIAATNRPDILDPALLRPGRFNRHVSVDLPTVDERQAILKIHARSKPMAEDIDMDVIARGTPGFSGADLENLLNEAAIMAARKKIERVGNDEVEEARDKVVMGLERKNLILTDDERRALSYHEAGHALVAVSVEQAEPIHKVTIIPHGQAMGVTQQLPERDRYVYDLAYLQDRIAVMMGGRASEKLVLATVTSGAEQDLKEATSLARRMVLDWGMGKNLGQVALGSRRRHVFLGEDIGHQREYSERTAREIDQEIKAIIDEGYERARIIVEEKRDKLDKLAEGLRENEQLLGEDVKRIVEDGH